MLDASNSPAFHPTHVRHQALTATAEGSQPRSSQPIPEWQHRVCQAYTQRSCDAAQRLKATLEARIREMLDTTPDPYTYYVDPAIPLAQARVDGLLFRLRGEQLLLVRGCVSCGLGLFESIPLREAVDLGYALTDWHPLHPDCAPEDVLIE